MWTTVRSSFNVGLCSWKSQCMATQCGMENSFSKEFIKTLDTLDVKQPVSWVSAILTEFIQKNPTRCSSASKFIIPYLYEAQHVSGDKPPIIKGLKPHWQPLVLHTWKVVGRVVAGRCQAEYTLLHLVGFFHMNCTTMHGSMNIKLTECFVTKMC